MIDLLPDRSAETFAQWLGEHPGVEVISRDRAGSYAEGATQGAPHAIQVSDRWHLLKNLGDALAEVLTRHQESVTRALQETPSDQDTAAATAHVDTLADTSTSTAEATLVGVAARAAAPSTGRRQALQEQRRALRRARYEQVCQLHRAGWTISAIADQVGLDRDTVRKYLNAPSFPERQPRTRRRRGILEPFKPYILERWNAGCHTATQILRELEQRGYRGGRTTVLAYVTQLRKAAGLPPKKRSGTTTALMSDPTRRPPSARSLSWVILRKPDEIDDTEQQQVAQIRQAHATLDRAIGLAQEFASMVRGRQHEQLDSWLDGAEASGVSALVSFAKGLRRDYAAVKAAMTLPWSNGPTEGHINRLKLLKRQTYGRANLDLLRQRVLMA